MKPAASIVRWVPLTIVAFSIVSIVALLQLDAVVNETLYLYGLIFNVDWAIPYWNTIRTALAMLFLILAVAIVFQASMIFFKPTTRRTENDESEG